MQITQIPNTLYIQRNELKKNSYVSTLAFSGSVAKPYETLSKKSKFFEPVAAPIRKARARLESKLADGFAKILGNKVVKSTIINSKSQHLSAHLQAAVGVILSGFYVKQTLQNKNLDEQKRKTLAINQAVVCGLSTAGAYFVNGVLGKKIDKFVQNFKDVNSTVLPDAMRKYEGGIRTAASLMIFATIYRFIAPVVATPIANKLGNHLQEKKQAKLAQQQAEVSK